jgi:hypothetical protein
MTSWPLSTSVHSTLWLVAADILHLFHEGTLNNSYKRVYLINAVSLRIVFLICIDVMLLSFLHPLLDNFDFDFFYFLYVVQKKI